MKIILLTCKFDPEPPLLKIITWLPFAYRIKPKPSIRVVKAFDDLALASSPIPDIATMNEEFSSTVLHHLSQLH